RPRGGDFLYSDVEFASMRADAGVFAQEGVEGVVAGFLDPNGAIDEARTRALVEAADPAKITFHRAFDMAGDPFTALETLIRAGVSHILTSGREPTAEAALDTLRRVHALAAGRVGIVACGGIRAHNLAAI